MILLPPEGSPLPRGPPPASICSPVVPACTYVVSGLGFRIAWGSLTGYIPNCNCGWSGSQHVGHTRMLTFLVLITICLSCFSLYLNPHLSHCDIAHLPEANLVGMISRKAPEAPTSKKPSPDPRWRPAATALRTPSLASQAGEAHLGSSSPSSKPAQPPYREASETECLG